MDKKKNFAIRLACWVIFASLTMGCGLLETAPPSRTFTVKDLLLTNVEVPARTDYPPTKPEETILKYWTQDSARMSWGTKTGIRYNVYRYIRVRFAQNTYQDLIVKPLDKLSDWTTATLHADEYNFRCDFTVNGHDCDLKARYEEFFIEVIFTAPKEVAKSDVDLVVRNMDARMMRYLHR